MSMDSHTFTPVGQIVVGKAIDSERDMYEPFQPRVEVKGEGEKYDPFDPTGSPASDSDGRSDSVRGVKRNGERGDDKEKDENLSDSTVTLTNLPSPCPIAALSLRQRVDCSTINAGEQSDNDDSDHSEIEEGEIVVAKYIDGSNKTPAVNIPPLSSPSHSLFVSKPERILRVLDEEGFVSVHLEAGWEVDKEPGDKSVGMEDLRSKLVSRQKERFLSFPTSSPHSPQPLSPSHPLAAVPSSHLRPPVEQQSKNYKSSKNSVDCDQPKSKDRKAQGKRERRKKRRKNKEAAQEWYKDKERGGKEGKRRRNSRSSSHRIKKRCYSSLEVAEKASDRRGCTGNLFSSQPEERQRERAQDKGRDRDKGRERHTERGSSRGRERHRNRQTEQSHNSNWRKKERDSSSQKKDRESKGRQHSSSREHSRSKRSKRNRGERESDRHRQCDRERQRNDRLVVPPSIQDLSGSDLFAIKRTITVTTTTTASTVPDSLRCTPTSPSPTEDSTKYNKKKKRKWHSIGEVEDQTTCHSQSQSLSPPRYHNYESDHYSGKMEIDVQSLDGEALDSDYPSLEATPPVTLPLELPIPSPKTKTTHKTGLNQLKKKPQMLKKIGQAESSSSSRIKGKCISSLMVTSGSAAISSGLTLAKQAKKMGKEKEHKKGYRKGLTHSGKSKKEGSRKSKLQSKVSVLLREGVSSTTGASLGSGKMSMDLLGPGGTTGGSGSSVVGGSIAVVFCRDNESRSPFLKPCLEPLSLGGRTKDLPAMKKQHRLAAPPPTLTSPASLKTKNTKPASVTSTSSSASSSSLSLGNKKRHRATKTNREKGEALRLIASDVTQTKASSELWGGASLDVQLAFGEGSKTVSPHTGEAGPAPCSSSSSSDFSVLLLSSPPHIPLPSVAALRDTRESSPDSQTVDSSCKTPDPSFLSEDCPTQTISKPAPSSPSNMSSSQGIGFTITLSTPTTKSTPPDDADTSLISGPRLSSSAGCGLSSLPLSSSDPSSVSSSSASKPPPLPSPALPTLPWSLQTGVDCTTGGVLACELNFMSEGSLPCYYKTFRLCLGMQQNL